MLRIILALCAFSIAFGAQATAAESGVIALNEASFRPTVAQGVTLVDFYANWCGPCMKMAPALDALAAELQGRVKITKYNIDQNKALANSYNVSSLPTLILFKNGQEVGRLVGYQEKEAIKRFVSQ